MLSTWLCASKDSSCKIKISPVSYFLTNVSVEALVTIFFYPCSPSGVSQSVKNSTKHRYSGSPWWPCGQMQKNETEEKHNMSPWYAMRCHPSVPRAQQSNLSRNCDIHTMFLTQISSVASEPAARICELSQVWQVLVACELLAVFHSPWSHVSRELLDCAHTRRLQWKFWPKTWC